MKTASNNQILFIVLAVIFIPGIGVDLYAPSLPAISQAFHASPAAGKMTATVYLLGLALGQIIFGLASDVIGRKRILLIGLSLFAVCNFVGANAGSIGVMLLARTLQGVGAASASVACKNILTDCYDGKRLNIVVSYLALAWAMGPIIAPALGGYIQHYINWSANFYFAGSLCVLTILLVVSLLRETLPRPRIFKFSDVCTQGLAILTHRRFMSAVLILGIEYAMIVAFNIFGPYLFQHSLHYTAFAYGHLALVMGSAYFIGTLANRYLLARLSVEKTMNAGMVLMIISCFLLMVFAYLLPMNVYTVMIPIYGSVFAIGLIYPNVLSVCMDLFREQAGLAVAIQGSLCLLVATSISALFSVLHTVSLIPTAWVFVFLAAAQLFFYRRLVDR